MTVQVDRLASLWFHRNEESIGERVDEKIDSYANGELDHAMEAMALLWSRSRLGSDLSLPSGTGDVSVSVLCLVRSSH